MVSEGLNLLFKSIVNENFLSIHLVPADLGRPHLKVVNRAIGTNVRVRRVRLNPISLRFRIFMVIFRVVFTHFFFQQGRSFVQRGQKFENKENQKTISV